MFSPQKLKKKGTPTQLNLSEKSTGNVLDLDLYLNLIHNLSIYLSNYLDRYELNYEYYFSYFILKLTQSFENDSKYGEILDLLLAKIVTGFPWIYQIYLSEEQQDLCKLNWVHFWYNLVALKTSKMDELTI